MRETHDELVAAIIGAVRNVEPHLTEQAVRDAVEATALSAPELQRLARTLRHDVSVLTGSAGSNCTANIEPLITTIQRIGGTAVRLPVCSHCRTNASETYSRQLRKRICRACASSRWRSAQAECVNCGKRRRQVYRARRGGMLCRECKPEPDVDHAAKVREGIGELKTGLSPAEVNDVASAFRTTVALRELNRIQHDSPAVFTGELPHRSVRSVRLAQLLIAAGATNIRKPHCPLCLRESALTAGLDGVRCCRRCWNHRRTRGACARCGQQRHLTNFHGSGQRLCSVCFTHDSRNQLPCTQCGRIAYITHRDGQVMLCRRCYRAPTAACSSCGQLRQCARVRSGRPICGTCAAKERAKETCSVCRKLRPVHLRTGCGEPVCGPCGRRREPCSRCGEARAVAARLEGVGPLCEVCLAREPAYFTDCVQCGTRGRAYHHGLCPECACPGVLHRLFSRDGELGGAAALIVETLLNCNAKSVLQWAQRTRLRSELAAGVRDLGDLLSHDALDDLPPSKSVEWLRDILVDAGVLPQRDRYLYRTEMFIDARLDTINNREDRAVARAFAEWHHLRRLRDQASRSPLKRGNGAGARQEIVAISTFLADLHARRLMLATCRQADVDDWLVCNPTRPQIHQFLAWAVRRGHARDVKAPTPETRRTRQTLPGDDERWQLIRCLVEDPDLETRDRVAGLLVLLYSQQTARLVTLKVTDVTVEADVVKLRLGAMPLLVPAPVDRLITDLVQQRRGYAAVDVGANPWLFPGGRSGGHLSATQMGLRLRRIGIPPRIARNTALIELAGELPAAVIAKLLGFSIKRAVAWNIEAGNTNPRYAAAVARNYRRG